MAVLGLKDCGISLMNYLDWPDISFTGLTKTEKWFLLNSQKKKLNYGLFQLYDVNCK